MTAHSGRGQGPQGPWSTQQHSACPDSARVTTLPCLFFGVSWREETEDSARHCQNQALWDVCLKKFDQFTFVQNGPPLPPVLLMDQGKERVGKLDLLWALLHCYKLASSVACIEHRICSATGGFFCKCMVNNRHLPRKQVPCADPLQLGLDSTAPHCLPGLLS